MAQAPHSSQRKATISQIRQPYTVSVSYDLASRIRALSFSKGERKHSRTSCLTLDLSYIPHLHETTPARSKERPRYQFSVAKAIERLDCLKSTMAKQTYDGGRRQNEELGVDEPNKDIDKTAIHERSLHVNQRDALQSSSIVNEIVDTPPHAQQRRVFPPGRAALPWLSAHPRRSPQDLQTPTPAPKKYEGASMTDPQQIPGSYISEDDRQQPPLANGRSSPTESYSSAISIPSSQKTVVQEHGLREKSSQNTITSTTSTRPIHHLLLATNTHQSRLGNAAKPVSTPRTEELGSCVALPRTVVLDVQRPIDEATSEGSVHDHVTALPFHTDGESSATRRGKS